MADDALQNKKGLDATRADLAATMQLQTVLETQRDALYEEARTLGVSDLVLPDLVHLNVHIDQIISQWDAFEKLIREKWPANGQEVATNIKKLLAIP